MAYIPLYKLLPEVAMKETCTITVAQQNHFRLPEGEYGMVEMFCNDEDCDCRRVIIMVMYSQAFKPVAYISFGWESQDYYASWYSSGKVTKYSDMDTDDQLRIEDMRIAHLNTMSPQSEIATTVFKMVDALVLQDRAYVDRLKHHYMQFRAKVDGQHRRID